MPQDRHLLEEGGDGGTLGAVGIRRKKKDAAKGPMTSRLLLAPSPTSGC